MAFIKRVSRKLKKTPVKESLADVASSADEQDDELADKLGGLRGKRQSPVQHAAVDSVSTTAPSGVSGLKRLDLASIFHSSGGAGQPRNKNEEHKMYEQMEQSISNGDDLESQVNEFLRQHSLDEKRKQRLSTATDLEIQEAYAFDAELDQIDEKRGDDMNINAMDVKFAFTYSPVMGPVGSTRLLGNLSSNDNIVRGTSTGNGNDYQQRPMSPFSFRRQNSAQESVSGYQGYNAYAAETSHTAGTVNTGGLITPAQHTPAPPDIEIIDHDATAAATAKNGLTGLNTAANYVYNKPKLSVASSVNVSANEMWGHATYNSNLVFCGNHLSGLTTILTQFRMFNNLQPSVLMNSNVEYQSAMMFSVIECVKCLFECSIELRDRYCLEINAITMTPEEIANIKKYDRLKRGLIESNLERYSKLVKEIDSAQAWSAYIEKKHPNTSNIFDLNENEILELNKKLNEYKQDIEMILKDKVIKFTVSKMYTCANYLYHNVVYWLFDKRENFQRLFDNVRFVPTETDYIYCHYVQDDFVRHTVTVKFDKDKELDISLYDASARYFTADNVVKRGASNLGNEEDLPDLAKHTSTELKSVADFVEDDGLIPIPIGSEIDCVVFVVSLSSYVEKAQNSEKYSNRLLESLDLFEMMLTNERVEKLDLYNVCLILTCCDEFKYLLQIIPFASQMSGYKDENDNVSVLKHIITEFEKVYVQCFVIPRIRASLKPENRDKKSRVNTTKKLKYFLISGWNTNGVSRVWKSLQEISFDSYRNQLIG